MYGASTRDYNRIIKDCDVASVVSCMADSTSSGPVLSGPSHDPVLAAFYPVYATEPCISRLTLAVQWRVSAKKYST